MTNTATLDMRSLYEKLYEGYGQVDRYAVNGLKDQKLNAEKSERQVSEAAAQLDRVKAEAKKLGVAATNRNILVGDPDRFQPRLADAVKSLNEIRYLNNELQESEQRIRELKGGLSLADARHVALREVAVRRAEWESDQKERTLFYRLSWALGALVLVGSFFFSGAYFHWSAWSGQGFFRGFLGVLLFILLRIIVPIGLAFIFMMIGGTENLEGYIKHWNEHEQKLMQWDGSSETKPEMAEFIGTEYSPVDVLKIRKGFIIGVGVALAVNLILLLTLG